MTEKLEQYIEIIDKLRSTLEITKNENENLKKRIKYLEDLSMHDSLTEILNRRGVVNAITSDNESYKYLVVCDIDNFKEVNDLHGHLIGDEVLIKVANIIKNNIRESDIFGRVGGDEFVIGFKNCDKDIVDIRLENIQKDVALINHEYNAINIGISIGTTYYDAVKGYDNNFFVADKEMYRVKKKNKKIVG